MAKTGSSKYEAQLFKQRTKMVLKIISLCSTTCCVTTCMINFFQQSNSTIFSVPCHRSKTWILVPLKMTTVIIIFVNIPMSQLCYTLLGANA